MRLFNHYRLRGRAGSGPTELEPGPGVTAKERGKLHLQRRRGLGGAVLRARLTRGEGARALQLTRVRRVVSRGAEACASSDGASGTGGRGSASGGSAVARPAGGGGGTA